MRGVLRAALIAAVPDAEGRVYEPMGASAETPKPFLVVRLGVEGDPAGTHFSRRQVLDVLVYDEPTTRQRIDRLAQAVLVALNHKKLTDPETGAAFFVDFGGSPLQDTYDADLRAPYRPVRFTLSRLDWLSGASWMRPDPVRGVRAFVSGRYPELSTDPTAWDPSNAEPGCYVRLASPSGGAFEVHAGGAWVEATVRCHFLTPRPESRRAYLVRLVEDFAAAQRVPLSDGSPFLLTNISADETADPHTEGQLALRGSVGVLSPWLMAALYPDGHPDDVPLGSVIGPDGLPIGYAVGPDGRPIGPDGVPVGPASVRTGRPSRLNRIHTTGAARGEVIRR